MILTFEELGEVFIKQINSKKYAFIGSLKVIDDKIMNMICDEQEMKVFDEKTAFYRKRESEIYLERQR